MARIKKKGVSGNAKNYITRSQAVRKLQISLPEFRRLCVFKGIYPREPRSKKKASRSATPSTTFYYAKDIQYLLHEPLLAKFRDQKALAKKISKALGRNEVSDAVRLERNLAPKIHLDHIIKERYPTFVDALRDLDDALALLFLFANLPSTDNVPPKMIAKCQRLTMEFEHYLIRTHSLRKSFLSIKGIYYQATVQGQDILWLVPYRFVQRTTGDVDFRIMATFVEFYTTLLGFVNFRLYTSIGLVYPPHFDTKCEEQGAELSAFTLGEDISNEEERRTKATGEDNLKAQAEADRLLLLEENGEAPTAMANAHESRISSAAAESATLDRFAPIDETADALVQPSLTSDAHGASTLFEPFTFYLARETPRHPLEFVLRAFGCKRVGWDSSLGEPGSYCAEDDRRITHHIVDRPDLPLPSPPLTDGEEGADVGEGRRGLSNARVPGRIYVQPQWVWDSINAGQLQRPDLYAPGATLPPHLSPWMKPKQGEYDPRLPLAAQESAAEIEAADNESSSGEDEELDGDATLEDSGLDPSSVVEDDGDMKVALATSDDDEDELAEYDGPEVAEDEEWGGFSENENEDDGDEASMRARQHQSDLEAEARGISVHDNVASAKKKAGDVAQTRKSRAEREAQEDVERRKMMMSRRKRKMYEKMVYSNARRDEEAERLRGKRRKIEKSTSRS